MEKKIIFSENFVWGAATSAYQSEGAVKEDGKGEHIWDVYTKEPGLVYSGHTGEVACDHYHRYDFLARYLRELRKAAEEADIRGYFQWSLMDNFEWSEGYAQRFGCHPQPPDAHPHAPRARFRRIIADGNRMCPEAAASGRFSLVKQGVWWYNILILIL